MDDKKLKRLERATSFLDMAIDVLIAFALFIVGALIGLLLIKISTC